MLCDVKMLVINVFFSPKIFHEYSLVKYLNVSKITVQGKVVMIPGCKIHTALRSVQRIQGMGYQKFLLVMCKTLPLMNIF